VTPPDPSARRARLLLWAAVVVGALLRLRQYLHGRSLWIDEAMLAVNILSRDFAGLTRQLDSDQIAPVPFLWAVRFATHLGGAGERALRLVAFLAGLLFLVVLAGLARRLLAPRAAALAAWIVALSPLLIYYANELKPYGVDALLATAVALAAVRLVEAPAGAGRWWTLGLLGLVTALSSMVAPLVLAGTALALVLAPEVRAQRGGVLRLAAWGLVWAASYAVVYLLVYRATSGSDYMQRYWVPAFLSPALPGLGRKVVVIPFEHVRDWFMGEATLLRGLAAAALFLPLAAGAARLARRRGLWLPVLFLAPPVLAALASSVRLYPLAPRLLLFVAPGVALLIAEGVEGIASRLGRIRPAPRFALATFAILALPTLDAVRELRVPREREAVAPLVAQLLAQAPPGAAIYVYGRSVPAWLYYTTNWSRPDTARLRHHLRLVSSTGAAFRHRGARGHAVEAEGDSLAYPLAAWTELIGVPTGTGPDSLGVNSPVVDAGWGENEARRIVTADGPEAWLVFSSHLPEVPDLLGAALAGQGGRQTLRLVAEGAEVGRWVLR
jgi:hypothetical protein